MISKTSVEYAWPNRSCVAMQAQGSNGAVAACPCTPHTLYALGEGGRESAIVVGSRFRI